jgi:hypothetical protein
MSENYFKRISNIFSKEKNSLNSKQESGKFEDDKFEEKEAQEVFSKAKINSTAFLGKNLTLDILKQEGLLPKHKIFIENDMFLYPSSAYDLGENRVAVVAYIKKNGKITVNSFYRSNSQGVWRYLPEYKIDEDGEIGSYSKGYGEESITLPIEIQKALSDITKEGMPVLNLKNNPEFVFAGTTHEAWKTDKKNIAYYQEVESTPHKLNGDFYLKNKKTTPEQIILTKEESPDFSKKITSWQQKTSLYGEILIEVFPSRDGKLKFMFSRDSMGRVWINGIENNSEIQSTGLRKSWINGGNLTTPAYEYDEMSAGYGNNNLKNGDYVDMYEKYLSKIPVIQEYINFHSTNQKEIKNENISISSTEINHMIHSAKDFTELFMALRKIKGLQGTTKYHEAGDLISLIIQVKSGEKDITYITRAGGLRSRVIDLLKIEELRG